MPKIVRRIIPKSNKNNPGLHMEPEYITLHETNNYHPRADALMHANFVSGGGGAAGVSWGYTVDDSQYIYQHLEDNQVGWHGGDGYYGTGNRKSIGVECCVNKGINITQRNENVIWIVNYLMSKHKKITKVKVVPHRRWSGKNCPTAMLKYWDDLINRIGGVNVDVEIVDDGLFSIGDKGEAVKKIQKTLNEVINAKLKVDGDFGPATERAVMNFQKKYNLVVDGIVGPNTLKRLDEELKANDGLLELGEDGQEIKSLQQRLKALGFNPGTVDGIFGKNTEKAVKDFQKSAGLSADGVVGPATFKALDQAEAAKKKKEQKDKEEEHMLEKAIVVHGEPDISAAVLLSRRLKAPIYITPNGVDKNVHIKTLYSVGFKADKKLADTIIPLYKEKGDRNDTVAAVDKFLDGI